jgi:O-antigen/teichoic acid export membrane protein
MPAQPTNNRTIAKNTLMLYGRALLMMLIGLYTSRVILHTLGVMDFGVYNAVGGIIGLFGFVTSSLGNATSRFITVAIGQGDQNLINKTFGNIKVIYYFLCIMIVLVSETIGVWFLYNKMTIPADRMIAAFWVFQFTIVSAVLDFVCVPYNSAIIAHEKMSAFAYISLLDAVFKLLICYVLLITPFDRLITYASLIFLVGVVDRIIYAVYCNSRFEEVHAKARIYTEQFREIMVFSGWTLSGNIAWVLNTQGANLLLNVFFGPVVNAARGIALQVQGVMQQFVTNFQTAINPQITKNYASHNYPRMHELVTLSTKYSYQLMLLMSIPVIIEAPEILKLWLKIVPDHTIPFLRWTLIAAVLTTVSNPLWVSVLATGKLKKYMAYDNTIQLIGIPLCYVLFKFFHAESEWLFIVMVLIEVIDIYIRAWIVLPLIDFPYRKYLKEVVLPLFLVTIASCIVPIIVYKEVDQSISGSLFVGMSSILWSSLIIWLIGMKKKERQFIISKVKLLVVKK